MIKIEIKPSDTLESLVKRFKLTSEQAREFADEAERVGLKAAATIYLPVLLADRSKAEDERTGSHTDVF
jgi:hypothetical protein